MDDKNLHVRAKEEIVAELRAIRSCAGGYFISLSCYLTS